MAPVANDEDNALPPAFVIVAVLPEQVAPLWPVPQMFIESPVTGLTVPVCVVAVVIVPVCVLFAVFTGLMYTVNLPEVEFVPLCPAARARFFSVPADAIGMPTAPLGRAPAAKFEVLQLMSLPVVKANGGNCM